MIGRFNIGKLIFLVDIHLR